MEEISVERIMNEIKAEIKKKGCKPSDLKFSDVKIKNPKNFDQEIFDNALSEACLNWQVEMYPVVSGGKVKRFVKKVIRKLVRPSFYGQMKKQEKFNVNSVTALNEMSKKIHELEERIKVLEGK